MITLTTFKGDRICILHKSIVAVESYGSKSVVKVGGERIIVQENLVKVMELIDSAKSENNNPEL
ncbi:hypothetical protein EFZ10_09010 [Tatumella sp. TA1]|uniref:flagellar FlbD family protein n=1 Tax=Rosenbergiella collisarenosi TaxID=1544695 RepID=UPI0008F90EBA|nr:flagellar FlbD family protein [Rosenbergiella collisarenosi]MBT0720675.1 hypothetical protein [Rosenbergiella collisarenosi]QGX91750.1 hypothetical protein EFZ10_09010 [Tatumella sp. TA1]